VIEGGESENRLYRDRDRDCYSDSDCGSDWRNLSEGTAAMNPSAVSTLERGSERGRERGSERERE
jgi:hypothetical protein